MFKLKQSFSSLGRGSRWFSLFLGLQCLILAGLLIFSLVRPQVTQTIPGELLQSTGALPVTAAQEGGVQVLSQEKVDRVPVFTLPIPLPSGAYDIEIQYQSVSNLQDPSCNIYDCAGWVDFELPSNPHALQANPLYLDDGARSVTGRIWLRMGAGAEDLTMEVNYYGVGKLAIQQVEIRECVQYRAVRILGFLALFAGIDLAILFFWKGFLFGWKKHRQYEALGILAITVFSSLLFFSGSLFNDGDLGFHLNRIISLAEALQEGQIPQRIQTQMLNGYGYTTPLFYGDLFLLLPALLMVLAVPVQTAYQIFVVCVNFATALVTYWCLKRMVADPRKAMAGTALYVFCFYRLHNLILRSAVGEYTAMIFLPLILYGFYRIYTAPDQEKLSLSACAPLIIGMTGIIESHMLSCEMTAFFSVAVAVIFWKKTFRPNRFMALAKSAVITFLLNAWYLIPFLDSFLSMDLVVNSGMSSGIVSTANFYQIFSFFPAPTGITGRTTNQELALSIGPAFTLVLGIYLLYRLWQVHHKENCPPHRGMDVLFLFAMAAAFLSSSVIPWGNLYHISKIAYHLVGMVQFSWRYLGIAAVCLTFATVLLFELIEKQFSPQWSNLLMGVMVGLTLISASHFYTTAADQMNTWKLYTLSDTDRMEIVYEEYLPLGTDSLLLEENHLITGEGVTVGELVREGTRSQIWCENASDGESYLDLPILAYDNYHAALEDGSPATLSAGENNRIRVTLPAGYEGVITVEYRPPVYWRVSEAVSLAALVGFAAALVLEKKKAALAQ